MVSAWVVVALILIVLWLTRKTARMAGYAEGFGDALALMTEDEADDGPFVEGQREAAREGRQ